MKTIKYQGKSIQAELVNRMDGVLLVAVREDYEVNHDMVEELYRDRQGQYYLSRKARIIDIDGHTQHHASGRTLVHCLSVKAAILWATVRMEASNYALRHDARQALRDPAAISAVRHFAGGSMAVTLHLKPGAARLFQAAHLSDDEDPACYLYQSLAARVVSTLSDGTAERETENEAVFDKDWPEVESAPRTGFLLRLVDASGAAVEEGNIDNTLLADIRRRAEECRGGWPFAVIDLLERGAASITDAYRTVELNDKVVALVGRYQRKSDAKISDIINGAAISMLECSLGNDSGPTFEEGMDEAANLRRGITFYEDEDEEEDAAGAPAADPKEGMRVRLLWNEDGSESDEIVLDPGVIEEVRAHGRKWNCGFAEAFNDWMLEALDKDGEGHDQAGDNFAAGRGAPINAADIALVAAAAPEPLEGEPLLEEEHQDEVQDGKEGK